MGFLPIRLSEEDVEAIISISKAATTSTTGKYELRIDLNECTLSDGDGFQRSI